MWPSRCDAEAAGRAGGSGTGRTDGTTNAVWARLFSGPGPQYRVIEESVQHHHGGRVAREAASAEGVELEDRDPHVPSLGTPPRGGLIRSVARVR